MQKRMPSLSAMIRMLHMCNIFQAPRNQLSLLVHMLTWSGCSLCLANDLIYLYCLIGVRYSVRIVCVNVLSGKKTKR